MILRNTRPVCSAEKVSVEKHASTPSHRSVGSQACSLLREWVFKLLACINLGPLQLVRIIHVDGFPLRVKVNCAQAALAVSIACGLGPAKRQVDFGANSRR